MLQGLMGGSDHHTVPVAYIGPVPGYDEKLAFVSLVWKPGKIQGFPEKYMEKALPCFESSPSIKGMITFRRKKCNVTSLQASSLNNL
jgi:hypothetical protein